MIRVVLLNDFFTIDFEKYCSYTIWLYIDLYMYKFPNTFKNIYGAFISQCFPN